ncbi:hypothetical protein BDN72DRAFT_218522 [Pluteus cervinus]|uniref:Uncharacterized protein n=1 Tax=Pluteus cervinus TaxID=181527 RepID=A0ACD3AH49_9AGAR|nr:hypothetical protein BDN72DRAFT_218522 [Pluteus cervinus]
MIQFQNWDISNLLPYQFLDPTSLVALHTSQDLEILNTCAVRFPMTRLLKISPCQTTPNTKWTMNSEWIEALSRFTHLDTIEGHGIWGIVDAGEITEQELTRRLAVACPNLRYLNNLRIEGSQRLVLRRLSSDDLGTGEGSELMCYSFEKHTVSLTRTFEPTSVPYDPVDSDYSPSPQPWRTVHLHSA